jgi:hypothetical protein
MVEAAQGQDTVVMGHRMEWGCSGCAEVSEDWGGSFFSQGILREQKVSGITGGGPHI